MMANWIHCNVCFSQQSATISKLSITSCGHMICENCSRRIGSENKCVKCGNVCDIVLIDEKLPPNIKVFFSSQKDVLQEAINLLQQTVLVQEFQSKNMTCILKTLQQKYSMAKNEIYKLRRENETLKRSQQALRHNMEINRQIPENFSPGSVFTPLSLGNSVQNAANDSMAFSITPQHMMTAEAPRNYRQPLQQQLQQQNGARGPPNNAYIRAPQQPQLGPRGGVAQRGGPMQLPLQPNNQGQQQQHHQQAPPMVDTANLHRYQQSRQQLNQQRCQVPAGYHRQQQQPQAQAPLRLHRDMGSSYHSLTSLQELELVE